jgi:hypothetical protein
MSSRLYLSIVAPTNVFHVILVASQQTFDLFVLSCYKLKNLQIFKVYRCGCNYIGYDWFLVFVTGSDEVDQLIYLS